MLGPNHPTQNQSQSAIDRATCSLCQPESGCWLIRARTKRIPHLYCADFWSRSQLLQLLPFDDYWHRVRDRGQFCYLLIYGYNRHLWDDILLRGDFRQHCDVPLWERLRKRRFQSGVSDYRCKPCSESSDWTYCRHYRVE
jgi:hypothetical protein